MKKFLIKKLISKKGYFDRELLVDLTNSNLLKFILRWKIYKNFLKPHFVKAGIPTKKHAMELMAQAFEPINFFSKLKYKFKK
jgi:hypothetical protein